MSRHVFLGLVVCLLATGCAPQAELGEPRDLHAEMGTQGDVPQVRLERSPGALGPEAPYLPLVRPPEVRRVWVTAHLGDDGDLIAGHWVYLMLEPSQWLLRNYQVPQELKLKLPTSAAPETSGR